MIILSTHLPLNLLTVLKPAVQQLQQSTPDTSGYMLAGFGVIFGAMLIYLISLMIRQRNLQQDLEMLQELEKRSAPPLNSASQAEKRPSNQV